MENRIIAIVNPVSAAKRTGKIWPQIEMQLKKSGVLFDTVFTEYPNHAKILSKKAILDGYNTIVAVGGDGTLNEVINGLFENNRLINSDIKIAVLSMGTGGDFIRSLEYNKGVESFIEVIKRDRTKKCNIGIARFKNYNGEDESRYFINIADVGLGGETTHRVNRASKVLRGFLSFLIGAIVSVLTYENRVFNICIDDKTNINDRLNSIFVCNGIFFGGGMKIAPFANIDDGLFDIVIIKAMNKIDILKNFSLIYKGEHINNPNIMCFKAKKVDIKTDKKTLIELDGEQPGSSNVCFEVSDQTINVLI